MSLIDRTIIGRPGSDWCKVEWEVILLLPGLLLAMVKTTATAWRITLPADLELSADPILQLTYAGDVGRVRLNGRLLSDDFSNGVPLEIGLRRYAPDILKGDLSFEVLPLTEDAPIYLAEEARPEFDADGLVAALKSCVLFQRNQIELIAT